MDGLFEILIVFILLVIGYFSGNYLEKRHYKSIRERERQTRHIPIITFGAKQFMLENTQNTELFIGSVVVSVDYFKRISASLRNLVGGRIMVYETLLDRGRREALLRLKENAIDWGATQIINVRLETSAIGGRSGNNRGLGSIEVIAYGTGIK
ncbi:heavy metal-binding domain-containing protein [Candidatus Parabeggiatoa sp. HSG14]|uniref:YbjQ family protein n=1 Tax=Candidatus Parabeggiatoa sp. HSG14 TaxID=3055593 RepID=UPI0025A84426|nr:heavy metal-binding domain-containing protein [Thiotrichales bacterium HSG14]